MKKLNLEILEKEVLYGIISKSESLNLEALETIKKIFVSLRKGGSVEKFPLKPGQATPDVGIKFVKGDIELEDAEFDLLKAKFEQFNNWKGSNATVVVPLKKKLDDASDASNKAKTKTKV
ncbi:MAG: hypothetical protein ACTSPI_11675 [Candidatus Heimdallarchaeaceae archaeon]